MYYWAYSENERESAKHLLASVIYIYYLLPCHPVLPLREIIRIEQYPKKWFVKQKNSPLYRPLKYQILCNYLDYK